MNRILLHICCAPCATAVLEELRSGGFSVSGYFYNPAIQPWKELKRRTEALEAWAPEADLPVEIFRDYPLEATLDMLLRAENRCYACFLDRMTRTARRASEMGIPGFSTTLLVSPYQNLELIHRAGLKAGEAAGVEYVHRDFTGLYKRSIELSREAGLYRQPYCGCIFSERDRYLNIRSPGQKG